MMLTLTAEVEGDEKGDLVEGLREILRLVDVGYLAGQDSNDSGAYGFRIQENA